MTSSAAILHSLATLLLLNHYSHLSSAFAPPPRFVPNYREAPTAATAHATCTTKEKLTRRNLFPFQELTENGKNKNDNGDDDDDDDDDPDWVKALLRWRTQPVPRKPAQMPPPTVEEEREALSEQEQDGRLRSTTNAARSAPVPLASLINVEALLFASGEDVLLDEVDDLGFFSSIMNGDRDVGRNGSVVVSPASDGAAKSLGTNETSSSSSSSSSSTVTAWSPLEILPKLEEQGDWNKLLSSLQLSIQDRSSVDGEVLATAAESILKEATSRMEYFLNETASVVPPATVEHLILRASKALALDEGGARAGEGIKAAADGITRAAEELAREQGLNVTEAAERARATTKYTAELVWAANGLLVSGYVRGDGGGGRGGDVASPGTGIAGDAKNGKAASAEGLELGTDTEESTRPLFDEFRTARAISNSDYRQAVTKSAEMASLSGAIYQNTVPECHGIGHAIVANGTSADVAWMVTDSIGYEEDFCSEEGNVNGLERRQRQLQRGAPILVRTITLRGFDASDDNVDRERLLVGICNAERVPMGNGVSVHGGLLAIARELYGDVVRYIDMAPPAHRIVLNGHSIGGSLSVLLLMLLTEERGSGFVLERILRVFTFGSPPVAISSSSHFGGFSCPTLEAFGLPCDLVYQYVQPWDPVVRLFSEIDACYPLIEDIGEDGVTLYASGPSRALRPITRAIIESWEGWPRFRDTFRTTCNQNFTGVGVQHLLLPEPTRYLADRLVSVNMAIPPINAVIQISSRELIPALRKTHPLDVFSISFVPAALRSFIHHFYPAYGSPFVEYAKRSIDNIEEAELGVEVQLSSKVTEKKLRVVDWAETSAQWILGGRGDGK